MMQPPCSRGIQMADSNLHNHHHHNCIAACRSSCCQWSSHSRMLARFRWSRLTVCWNAATSVHRHHARRVSPAPTAVGLTPCVHSHCCAVCTQQLRICVLYTASGAEEPRAPTHSPQLLRAAGAGRSGQPQGPFWGRETSYGCFLLGSAYRYWIISHVLGRVCVFPSAFVCAVYVRCMQNQPAQMSRRACVRVSARDKGYFRVYAAVLRRGLEDCEAGSAGQGIGSGYCNAVGAGDDMT